MFTGMKQLRDENQFCDVTIKIGDKQYHAHKVVLASSCEYFQRMFSSGFREATAAEISMEGDSSTFEHLLDFTYRGSYSLQDLSTKKMCDVLQMACYLQFNHAALFCSQYLTQHMRNINFVSKHRRNSKKQPDISLQTAYEMVFLSNSHEDLKELGSCMKNYIRSQFPVLTTKPELFEDTSIQCLENCLEDKELRKPADEEVCC